MRDRLTSVVALLLLAIVTATSFWYARALRFSGDAAAIAEAPDLTAEHVALTEFDALGRAQRTLFATTLSHRSDNDIADLTLPRLVSRRPDQLQLEVRAQRGWIEDGAARVHLEGEVVIDRAASATQPPLRISTDYLVALPDYERFATDRPVLLERGQSTVHARGMQFDNVAQTVELDADVHATLIAPARARPAP